MKSAVFVALIITFPNTWGYPSNSNYKIKYGPLPSKIRLTKDDLVEQATVWSGLNGFLYADKIEDGLTTWVHAPMSLSPNVFSRSAFEYAQGIQEIINVLIDNISRDKEFLKETLGPLASDSFICELLEIYNSVSEEEMKTNYQLGIHRSDYMIHFDGQSEIPLQVEMNTIASSFGCLSQKVGHFHKYLFHRFGESNLLASLILQNISNLNEEQSKNVVSLIPENNSVEQLSKALSTAHGIFNISDACILFVVQPGEKNVRRFRIKTDWLI